MTGVDIARLTPGQRQALVRKLRQRQRGPQPAQANAIPRYDRTRPLELSPAQSQIWLIDQLEDHTHGYNIAGACRIKGAVDPARLARAFAAVIARHEILRTCYRTCRGRPRAVLRARLPAPVTSTDLRALDGATRSRALRAVCDAAYRRPFDLTAEAMGRLRLVRLAETSWALIVTLHHIAVDGWSVGILVRELTDFYNVPERERPACRVQYGDYSTWQRHRLQGERLTALLDYWREHLREAPAHITLPCDFVRPARQRFVGHKTPVHIAPDLHARLQRLAREQNVTVFMLVLAGFGLLLSRLSGNDRLVVGTPVANRDHEAVESTIGFFSNTIPLHLDFGDAPALSTVLARVRAATLGGFAHAELPFERLVQELRPERDLGRNPIFQVLFAMQNVPAARSDLDGLQLAGTDEAVSLPIAEDNHFDLSLHLWPQGEAGALAGHLMAGAALFRPDTIAAVAEQLQGVLTAMVADGSATPRVLTDDPAAYGDAGAGASEVPAPAHPAAPGIQHLVARQARRQPDAIVLVCDDVRVSRGSLHRRVQNVAGALKDAGVERGEVVGILAERSIDLVTGILGTVHAGGAFLPLDRKYPPERVADMMDDSRVGIIVTDRHETVPGRRCVQIEAAARRASMATGTAVPLAGPHQLAYMIYTSGSTGRPKGVMISQSALCEYVDTLGRRLGIRQSDRYLHTAAASFSSSVRQLFMPMTRGAMVVLTTEDQRRDPPLTLELVERQRATVMDLIPSYWRSCGAALQAGVADARPPAIDSLRLVVSASEPLPPDIVTTWRAHAPAGIDTVNMFGQTETTGIAATTAIREIDLRRTTCVTVGRPLFGRRFLVCDERGEVVPRGARGECCIAGNGIGLGYHRRAGLTAERFICAPKGRGGARAYRTGDQIRRRGDGCHDHLGRRDSQVKVRGFRVELGEIERRIREQDRVRDCLIVTRQQQDVTVLIACIIPDGVMVPEDLAALRRELQYTLPDYMVPSRFHLMERFPTTANGKLDRRALAAAAESEAVQVATPSDGAAGAAPRDGIEVALVAIWEALLERTGIGIDDDFFAIGGHSLLAVRLIDEIRRRLQVVVRLATVYATPTVASLAAHIRRQGVEAAPGHMVPLTPRPGLPKIFAIHAAGGEAHSYIPLSRELASSVAFYALQATTDPEAFAPDLEHLAERYLDEIRTVQGSGPYHLAGWSFGGLVAYEIARRLHAAGETVATLAFIDTHAPQTHSRSTATGAQFLYDFWQEELILDWPALVRTHDEAALLAALVAAACDQGLLPPGVSVDAVRATLRVLEHHRDLYGAYTCPPYAGDLDLFCCEASDGAAMAAAWRAHVAGTVRVTKVPGTHLSVLKPRYCGAVAGAVRAAMGHALLPHPEPTGTRASVDNASSLNNPHPHTAKHGRVDGRG